MMLYAMIRASGSVEGVLKVLVIIRQIRVISGQKKSVASDYHLPPTLNCPSFIVHRSSSIVHRPSYIVHRPLSIVHRPSYIVHRTLNHIPSYSFTASKHGHFFIGLNTLCPAIRAFGNLSRNCFNSFSRATF